MSEHSRRHFLKSASIGAAAAGVAVAVPFGAEAAEAAPAGPAHAGPVVAWVKNPASGDISVMADDREIVHHDPKLARQLARLAALAAK